MSNRNSNLNKSINIDWEAIWQSLDWDDSARQKEVIEERLKQRAHQYAKPSKQQVSYLEEKEVAHQLLTFKLGAEQYGIDVGLVTSVRSVGKITRVPGSPSFYRGVVNIRGQIITVLDLRILLSLSIDSSDLPSELIVVKNHLLELAILADHVSDVERIPIDTIEPVEITYARGVTLDRLIVLDTEQLLSDERLFVGGVES